MTAARRSAKDGGKPELAGRLERIAILARTISDLARDLDRDPDEFLTAMVAIRELATTIHDHLDAEVRKIDTVGIGYLCPVRAELDDALRAATPKVTA